MNYSILILALQVCLLSLLHANPAEGQDLNRTVSIRLEGASVRQSLSILEKKGHIHLFIREGAMEGVSKRVSLSDSSIRIREALEQILAHTNLLYKSVNGFVVIDGKPGPQQPGRITGRVLDERGELLAGATIRVPSLNRALQTGADGAYQLSLEAGTYVLEVSYLGYQTKQITSVAVNSGKNTPLDVVLQAANAALGEVTVTADYKRASVEGLYARQKNNPGISDGISAEQIGRTPDKNIGETLRRISGLTSLDNKYVVVRGLSERYNQAMMNGQIMPSTELNRKNFSYDIIPSNLVDNVIVTKTLTPDQSAEFGGGLVQVNTKDIPTENSLSITIGSAYNDKTTGNDFRSPEIGKGQYFGAVPDSRKLFGSLGWKSREEILQTANFVPGGQGDYTLKQPSLIPNNWGIHRYTPSPSYNGQLSFAHLMPLKREGRQLGFVASASYRNTWQTSDVGMSRDGYAPNPASDSTTFIGKRYGFVTNIGGLAGIGYRTGHHKLSLQSVYLRTVDQQFITGTGHNDVTGPYSAGYNDLFTVTDLWQTQLRTEHQLNQNGAHLNLSLSYTRLDRQKPDNHQANFTYLGDGDDSPDNSLSDYTVTSAVSSGISAGALRWWSRALEKNLAWNADVSWPFQFNTGSFATSNLFKAGYAGWEKDRLFYVLLTGSKGFTDTPAPLSEVFDPARGGEIYTSQFGDDFHKKPLLHAGYLMMDNKISDKLRLVWGLRGEYYNLNGFNALLESFIDNQRTYNNDLTDYSELFNREPFSLRPT